MNPWKFHFLVWVKLRINQGSVLEGFRETRKRVLWNIDLVQSPLFCKRGDSFKPLESPLFNRFIISVSSHSQESRGQGAIENWKIADIWEMYLLRQPLAKRLNPLIQDYHTLSETELVQLAHYILISVNSSAVHVVSAKIWL